MIEADVYTRFLYRSFALQDLTLSLFLQIPAQYLKAAESAAAAAEAGQHVHIPQEQPLDPYGGLAPHEVPADYDDYIYNGSGVSVRTKERRVPPFRPSVLSLVDSVIFLSEWAVMKALRGKGILFPILALQDVGAS